MMLSFLLAGLLVSVQGQPPPMPTLTFGTKIRIAEAYHDSPGATAGDGCIAAEGRLRSGGIVISKVIFDGIKGRMRQTNARLERKPTENVTNIGRWDRASPREWDLTTTVGGSVTCASELLPPVMCPNGTLPPSCPPRFGSWGGLNPFTSILGMWYPNTSKLASSSTYDLYQFIDVQRTLLPNDGCGTSACTMEHCSKCRGKDGSKCTKCPCENCIEEVDVTRNYTYKVAKETQADGTHQLLQYRWTQGMPFKKNGATPGVGRDCFIFDWSQDWTSKVEDGDFAPPKGIKCS